LGGRVLEGPTTRSGRVRKNRMALNNPEREKSVLANRVNWYGILEPLKNNIRATLLGSMQIMYTRG